MFEKLDEEMGKRDIEAVLVYGDSTLGNPDLTYVIGGAVPRGGYFFKRRSKEPFLIVKDFDIELARNYGRLRNYYTYTDFGMEELTMKYGPAQAIPQLLAKILSDNEIKGSVVLAGRNDLTAGIGIADQLRSMGFKVTGDISQSLIESLRETKSDEEIQELRRVARSTCRVVEFILDVMRNMKRKRGGLNLGGKPATIGAVKSLISQRLLAEHLSEPEGTIFAQGASAIPVHNMGIPTQKLKEGKLIIFDIFPQAGTSYWCDMTRSFVIGRADAKARRIYEAVYEAQTETSDYLREGITGEQAMNKACDIIERHGYRTVRDLYGGKTTNLPSGMTHTLGHGVGLTIGERPYLTFGNHKGFENRNVVTVEPGVYLPGYGGVRFEDTVLITPKGAENLTKTEKELELV
ncbi:MAG: Xaa-Pro peptidase family protein [Candidatus Bathyarchaeia archaeon]